MAKPVIGVLENPAAQFVINAIRGDTLHHEITHYSDGVVTDFTGCTAVCKVKAVKGDAVILLQPVITLSTASAGLAYSNDPLTVITPNIMIDVDAATMAAIPASVQDAEPVFDLQITHASTFVRTYIDGIFNVIADV